MVARFVRDEEAAGSNPVIPTTLNLSNQAISEVFALSRKVQKNEFDHMLSHSYTRKRQLWQGFTDIYVAFFTSKMPKEASVCSILRLPIYLIPFSLFNAYHILIYPKTTARIFLTFSRFRFSLFKAYHFLDYMNKTEISLYLFYYINNLIYILLSKRYVFIVYNKTRNTHHIVFFL